MTQDELVERVSMEICRAGGYGLCVGFCHSKRCTSAIEQHGQTARAIIPIVQAERDQQIVAWARGEAQGCDCFARSTGECACGAWYSEPGERSMKQAYIEDIADAIERGEPWEGQTNGN